MATDPKDPVATGAPLDLRTGQALDTSATEPALQTAAAGTAKITPVETVELADIGAELKVAQASAPAKDPAPVRTADFSSRMEGMLKNAENLKIENLGAIASVQYQEALVDKTPAQLRQDMVDFRSQIPSSGAGPIEQQVMAKAADSVISAIDAAGTDHKAFGKKLAENIAQDPILTMALKSAADGATQDAVLAGSNHTAAGIGGMFGNMDFSALMQMGPLGMLLGMMFMIMGAENPKLLAQLTGQHVEPTQEERLAEIESLKDQVKKETDPAKKAELQKDLDAQREQLAEIEAKKAEIADAAEDKTEKTAAAAPDSVAETRTELKPDADLADLKGPPHSSAILKGALGAADSLVLFGAGGMAARAISAFNKAAQGQAPEPDAPAATQTADLQADATQTTKVTAITLGG